MSKATVQTTIIFLAILAIVTYQFYVVPMIGWHGSIANSYYPPPTEVYSTPDEPGEPSLMKLYLPLISHEPLLEFEDFSYYVADVFNYDYSAYVTFSLVKSAVENYIQGFHYEIGSRPVILTVAVGINASVQPQQAHATNFGNMIDDLNLWAQQNGYNAHVEIVGAIDIETQWIADPNLVDPVAVVN